MGIPSPREGLAPRSHSVGGRSGASCSGVGVGRIEDGGLGRGVAHEIQDGHILQLERRFRPVRANASRVCLWAWAVHGSRGPVSRGSRG
jgi:hypothetical protein